MRITDDPIQNIHRCFVPGLINQSNRKFHLGANSAGTWTKPDGVFHKLRIVTKTEAFPNMTILLVLIDTHYKCNNR